MSSIALLRCVFARCIFCLVFALVLGSCSKPEQMVDLRKLRELRDWQTVPLRDMLNKSADSVCVVGPYLTEVYKEVPFRDRINAHLRATNFANGEGEWAFIFVLGDDIVVQKFSDYRDRLYFAATHPNLPRTFRAVECATIDRARMTKVPGPAVILGEDS